MDSGSMAKAHPRTSATSYRRSSSPPGAGRRRRVTIRLRGINLHPVKSTAIRPVERADVGGSGLVGDREWMVIDADGDLVTARERPVMFRVVADTPATGCPADVPLRLSAPLLGLAPLDVVPHDGSVDVRIHGRGP